MKIQQNKYFNPISITLETSEEARLFISIIDKIDWKKNHANPPPDISKDEYKLAVKISDFFTENVKV